MTFVVACRSTLHVASLEGGLQETLILTAVALGRTEYFSNPNGSLLDFAEGPVRVLDDLHALLEPAAGAIEDRFQLCEPCGQAFGGHLSSCLPPLRLIGRWRSGYCRLAR